MTCFLYKNPRAVLIHIPKTGGTSIRAAFKGPLVRRCFGHIPVDWMNAPKIAVVRHPEARFLSAFRMFKFGSSGADGKGEPARIPDLTINQALDCLENPRVAFDRMQRVELGNLKHHLLPQTHPYNCLHLADHILRQETLAQDILNLDLDGLGELPELRRGVEAKIGLSEQQRSRLADIMAEDYSWLGYSVDGGIVSEVKTLSRSGNQVWSAWPAFFSDATITSKDADTSLPDVDVDLSLFAKDIIAGEQKGTWPGRSKNLVEHFQKLLPEFVGQSRIAHLLACCIVVIRKTNGCGPGLDLFWRILEEHPDTVFADMNSRWLTSVADTLADCGKTDAQRAVGLCGSILSATVKLAETEKQIYAVPRPWPPAGRLRKSGLLYDGVISFWGEKGDMIDNLLERISKAVDMDPIGGHLLLAITSRILQCDTVIQRMIDLADRPNVPVISPDTRAALERIVAKAL